MGRQDPEAGNDIAAKLRRNRERVSVGLAPKPIFSPQSAVQAPKPVQLTGRNGTPTPGQHRQQPLPSAMAAARNRPIAPGASRNPKLQAGPGGRGSPVPRMNAKTAPGFHESRVSSPLTGPPQRPRFPSDHAEIPSPNTYNKMQDFASLATYNDPDEGLGPRPESDASLQKYWDKASMSTATPPIGQHGAAEFPFPTPPQRSAKKGGTSVPPLAKRRSSAHSYYSRSSYVASIPEEEEIPEVPKLRKEDSMASLPSSRPVTLGWGSDVDPDELREPDTSHFDVKAASSIGSDISDTVDLVRQASVGKKMKPALTSVRSNVETRPGETRIVIPRSSLKSSQPSVPKSTIKESLAAGFGITTATSPPETPVLNQSISDRPVFADSRPDSSSSSVYTLEKPRLVDASSRSRSPLVAIGAKSAYQPGSPLSIGSPPVGMSEKIPSSRRPPRLNIDAVRDAEARGSLTSLPELIRRATRLASNLDRGKSRSKMDLSEFGNEKDMDRHMRRPRSGSISDILASFPPPGLGTPTGDRPTSRWPAPFSPSRLFYRMSHLSSHGSNSPRMVKVHRRCCGLSMRTFCILAIFLFLLIAAAIVVPVVLLVIIPNSRTSSTSANAQDNCQAANPCLNGGVSILSGSSCSCICVNGYTGDKCGNAADPACAAVDPGFGQNATVGAAISRVLSTAQTNFSIPLSSPTIVGILSNSTLSCGSQNALINFNGQSSKTKRFFPLIADEPQPLSGPLILPDSIFRPSEPTITRNLIFPRQNAALSTASAGSADGIVFASETLTAASSATIAATATASIVAASATTSAAASARPNSNLFQSDDTLDFARILVLYTMQQVGAISAGIDAQNQVQQYFLSRSGDNTLGVNVGSVSLTADFDKFSIRSGSKSVGGLGTGNGRLNNSNSAQKARARRKDENGSTDMWSTGHANQ